MTAGDEPLYNSEAMGGSQGHVSGICKDWMLGEVHLKARDDCISSPPFLLRRPLAPWSHSS